MIVLWIILAIVAIILILAALIIFTGHLKLKLSYSDDTGFSLKAYILSINLFDTEKKKKRNPHYKHAKKSVSNSHKSKPRSKQTHKQSYPITDIIRIAKNILVAFFEKQAKHLSVRAVKLNISVATSDAATTAILYGAVSQGVAYILELLDNINKLKPIKKSDINIYPDYTSDKSSADIKFTFSLPIKSAIALLLDSEILGLFAPEQKQ